MSTELPSERYKLLVDQLKAELGGGYGWKAEVARRLGVAPSYIAKIDAGEAGSVGPKIIAKACKRLGLPGTWFTSPTNPGHYSDQATPRPSVLYTDRYKLLVAQIRDDLRGHRGWMTRASELLGVTPSYVSRIAGEKIDEVGLAAVHRAVDQLGLDPAFFESAETPGHFREHIRPKASVARSDATSPREVLIALEALSAADRREVIRFALLRWPLDDGGGA